MPTTHEVEIDSWDQLGRDICTPLPSQYITFELRQPYGAQASLCQSLCIAQIIRLAVSSSTPWRVYA